MTPNEILGCAVLASLVVGYVFGRLDAWHRRRCKDEALLDSVRAATPYADSLMPPKRPKVRAAPRKRKT